MGCVFVTEDVGFSVGQLQPPIAPAAAGQTRRPQLPSLQPTAEVRCCCCSSVVAEDLPSDLNTVVFSLRAGFIPLTTSPSSANTSA